MARVGREREGDDVTERHSRGETKREEESERRRRRRRSSAQKKWKWKTEREAGKKESVGFQTCPIFFRKEDRRRRRKEI